MERTPKKLTLAKRRTRVVDERSALFIVRRQLQPPDAPSFGIPSVVAWTFGSNTSNGRPRGSTNLPGGPHGAANPPAPPDREHRVTLFVYDY